MIMQLHQPPAQALLCMNIWPYVLSYLQASSCLPMLVQVATAVAEMAGQCQHALNAGSDSEQRWRDASDDITIPQPGQDQPPLAFLRRAYTEHLVRSKPPSDAAPAPVPDHWGHLEKCSLLEVMYCVMALWAVKAEGGGCLVGSSSSSAGDLQILVARFHRLSAMAVKHRCLLQQPQAALTLLGGSRCNMHITRGKALHRMRGRITIPRSLGYCCSVRPWLSAILYQNLRFQVMLLACFLSFEADSASAAPHPGISPDLKQSLDFI